MNTSANSTVYASTTMAAPPLHHDTVRERIDVMLWLEVSQYRTADYLAYDQHLSQTLCGEDLEDGLMGEQWRTRMCEWAYQCKHLRQLGCGCFLLPEIRMHV